MSLPAAIPAGLQTVNVEMVIEVPFVDFSQIFLSDSSESASPPLEKSPGSGLGGLSTPSSKVPAGIADQRFTKLITFLSYSSRDSTNRSTRG